MKKIYINPNIDIVDIETENLLAGSNEDLGVWDDVTVDDALSKEHKGYSVWDFDNEEE